MAVNYPGKRVSDYDDAELAGKAYECAASVEEANDDFRATNISLFNTHVFGKKNFASSTVTEMINLPRKNLQQFNLQTEESSSAVVANNSNLSSISVTD